MNNFKISIEATPGGLYKGTYWVVIEISGMKFIHGITPDKMNKFSGFSRKECEKIVSRIEKELNQNKIDDSPYFDHCLGVSSDWD